MRFPVKSGWRGWAAVGLVVLAAEMFDEMTMSEAFGSFSREPVGRVVTITLWGTLTAHLFGVFPEKYDPIYQFAQYARIPHRTRVAAKAAISG